MFFVVFVVFVTFVIFVMRRRPCSVIAATLI
jgi:hypothetical protein